MIRWAALIAALLASSPAGAQCLGFQCPPSVLGAGTSGAPLPLDAFTTPSGAYSFRKLKSTYTGFAVQLQRVDTTTQNIGFTATGDFDTAVATTFCTTACTIRTWYDQSGNVRDWSQTTAANQPLLIFNCNGTLPCFRLTVTTQVLIGSSFTPATGVVSMSGVAKRSGGSAGQCVPVRENGIAGNRLQIGGAAASIVLAGGTSGSITAAAADGSWHAMQGVIAGAAGVLNVDGTETTGTATGSTTAAIPGTSNTVTSPVLCDIAESVFWDAYQLTPAERTALTNNQRNYWMPAVLDSFATPSGAYSFRKLLSSYTGPAMRIRRASDNAETDINFLGFTSFTGAPWDQAAAVAHCAATTCFGVTLYDQSGNARHLTQATPANQPPLILSCQAGIACMETTDNLHALVGPSVTPVTGIASFSAVGNRVTSTTGTCVWLRYNGTTGQRLNTSAALNTWRVQGGTSGNALAAGVADGAWHAANAIVNGASSVINVDGTETAGSAVGSTTAGTMAVGGNTGTTCRHSEAVVWDNYSLTAGERAVLIANQRSFWGTP